jgi:hypothetical protein
MAGRQFNMIKLHTRNESTLLAAICYFGNKQREKEREREKDRERESERQTEKGKSYISADTSNLVLFAQLTLSGSLDKKLRKGNWIKFKVTKYI